MSQPHTLLTTGEAAAQLSVTDETIRRWAASGKIPAITLPSGHLRIRQADVDAIVSGDPAEAGTR